MTVAFFFKSRSI